MYVIGLLSEILELLVKVKLFVQALTDVVTKATFGDGKIVKALLTVAVQL